MRALALAVVGLAVVLAAVLVGAPARASDDCVSHYDWGAVMAVWLTACALEDHDERAFGEHRWHDIPAGVSHGSQSGHAFPVPVSYSEGGYAVLGQEGSDPCSDACYRGGFWLGYYAGVRLLPEPLWMVGFDLTPWVVVAQEEDSDGWNSSRRTNTTHASAGVGTFVQVPPDYGWTSTEAYVVQSHRAGEPCQHRAGVASDAAGTDEGVEVRATCLVEVGRLPPFPDLDGPGT